MSFDPASLLLSLLISTIGWGFFKYGRKQERFPQIVTGVLLMVYPYFVQGAALMAVVGAGLVALMWGAIQLGL